jgi:hypothetical protein
LEANLDDDHAVELTVTRRTPSACLPAPRDTASLPTTTTSAASLSET